MDIKEEFDKVKEFVNETKEKAQEKFDEKVTEEDIMKILDACYEKCLTGVGKVIPTVDDLANDYLEKNPNPETAVKSMQKYQIAKCTTAGFITGFGGIISLPVSIPANIGSVLYVQMRMIACTAKIAGYDLNSDQVQTLVYACLAGISVSELLKGAGIKFGEKLALAAIKKIPGEVITKINKAVGFRLLTKMGETGIVNLGKLVPGVGAVINGGFDLVETKIIADRAYKMFFEGDFESNSDEINVIEVEVDETGE